MQLRAFGRRYRLSCVMLLLPKAAAPSRAQRRHHLLSCASSLPVQRLSGQIRRAIIEQRYPSFVREYVAQQYPRGGVPDWVIEGCQLAGIELDLRAAGQGAANGAAEAADGTAPAAEHVPHAEEDTCSRGTAPAASSGGIGKEAGACESGSLAAWRQEQQGHG